MLHCLLHICAAAVIIEEHSENIRLTLPQLVSGLSELLFDWSNLYTLHKVFRKQQKIFT